MFLLNSSKENLQDIASKASKAFDPSGTIAALNGGRFDIFYHILPNGDVCYEALAKDALPRPYLSFSVGADKKISATAEPSGYDDYCLASFIARKDNSRSVDELKAAYGPDFDRLYPLASLLEEEGAEVKDAEKDLAELKKEFLAVPPSASQSEPVLLVSLLFSFSPNSFYSGYIEMNCRMLLPSSRTGTEIPHLIGFCSSLLRDGECYRGRSKITMASFPKDYTDIFTFILSHDSGKSYYERSVFISFPSFISLCALLKGEKILFGGLSYAIDGESEEGKVSLGEKGEVTLFPPYCQGSSLLLSEKEGILVNKKKKTITNLTFPSLVAGKLYDFFLKHGSLPKSYLSSILEKDILPFAKPSDLPVSSEYLAIHPVRKDEISFYLTYLENDTLECKTLYYLSSNESKKPEFVASSPFNASRAEAFLSSLGSFSLLENGIIKDDETIASILRNDLTVLNQFATVYLSDNLLAKKVVSAPKIKIEASSGEDWFALTLHSDLYSEEDLYRLLMAYKKKRKYVRLGSSFLFIDRNDESLKEVKDITEDFDLEKGKKMPLYEALKLRGYAKDDLSLSASLSAMLSSIQAFDGDPLPGLAPQFKKVLRPYQLSGVRWLKRIADNSLSGILADDMGLGKTLETIAYLSLSKSEGPTLIVSPKSLIYNWENEFSKWDPKRKVKVIDGPFAARSLCIGSISDKDDGVYVTSYDSLRNDIDLYKKRHYGHIVLDEGQYIANALAKKTVAVKELEATHRLVLTGTPIQNSLMDLWSIFDFLLPNYLPKYSSFKSLYGGLSIEEEASLRLKKKIAPFILSRKKEDVLKDLPPKEELVLTITLSDEQRSLYEAYLAKARSALHESSGSPFASDKKIALLAALTRLREICVDPSIFLPNALEGEKVDSLVRQLKEAIATGHKCLVFSSFSSALIHLSSFLDKAKLSWGLIYGDTPAKERTRLAEAFNASPDPKVMLVSLKAGGTGLNLIGGDYVFHLDPWWNLAAERQASDRAHRIGQTRKVTVYKLVAKDSVEEKVIALQAKKASLSSIISKGDEGLSSLSAEDIAYLLD